jgi:hypothetical protein
VCNDRKIADMGRERRTVGFNGRSKAPAVPSNGQSRDDEKTVMPIPVASIVPAGIGSTLERQEQGWAYFRP